MIDKTTEEIYIVVRDKIGISTVGIVGSSAFHIGLQKLYNIVNKRTKEDRDKIYRDVRRKFNA